MFQITNGRLILAVDLDKNPSYENSVNHMLTNFADEYPKYKLDFKITITKNVDVIRIISARLANDFERGIYYGKIC